MEDLKRIIAANISTLRRSAGLTQLDLATKLNYSDKAVSKWESGASVPDVGVLLDIAELFGVTVDYLLTEEHSEPLKTAAKQKGITQSKRMITLLSVALVWLIATISFVTMNMAGLGRYGWLSFIWAIPVSCIVLIVFNSIWSAPRKNYIYISVLMWSLLLSVYLTFLNSNPWLIFTLGIPGQIIIVLWSGMKRK